MGADGFMGLPDPLCEMGLSPPCYLGLPGPQRGKEWPSLSVLKVCSALRVRGTGVCPGT